MRGWIKIEIGDDSTKISGGIPGKWDDDMCVIPGSTWPNSGDTDDVFLVISEAVQDALYRLSYEDARRPPGSPQLMVDSLDLRDEGGKLLYSCKLSQKTLVKNGESIQFSIQLS